MSTLLLFGAGASAFSGECYPEPPPLGTKLFDELATRGGVASTVDGDLVETFRQNFEQGMAEFRRRRGAEVTAFLLMMADYFARFAPGPANLYIDLLNHLSDTRRKFAIATLNYELLIELAVTHIGRTVAYTLSGGPRDISVLKPHGSCNFLPDLAPRQFYNFSVLIADPSMHASILEAPVRIADLPEVLEFCARENAIAPAIALYEKSKDTLFCPSFVKQQQREFKTAVEKATRIFVIGVRVNDEDEHIWLPLAHAGGSLHYVGPDPTEFRAWTAIHRRRRADHFAQSFEEAVPKIISVHARR